MEFTVQVLLAVDKPSSRTRGFDETKASEQFQDFMEKVHRDNFCLKDVIPVPAGFRDVDPLALALYHIQNEQYETGVEILKHLGEDPKIITYIESEDPVVQWEGIRVLRAIPFIFEKIETIRENKAQFSEVSPSSWAFTVRGDSRRIVEKISTSHPDTALLLEWRQDPALRQFWFDWLARQYPDLEFNLCQGSEPNVKTGRILWETYRYHHTKMASSDKLNQFELDSSSPPTRPFSHRL